MDLLKLLEFTDQFIVELSRDSGSIELLDRQGSKSMPNSILVKMEAVHSHVNANFVLYPPEKLRGDMEFQVNGLKMPTGMYSFTEPYPKPVLINHNHHDVKATVGRVERAYFTDKTVPGLPGGIIEARITDPEAIKAVLDGRYFTVSVGLSSDAAYCSICGNNWVEDSCEHVRGQEYDGRLAYWTSGNIWFKEVSFVNVPADRFAKVVGVSIENSASGAGHRDSAVRASSSFYLNAARPQAGGVVALVSGKEETREVAALEKPESPELEAKDHEGESDVTPSTQDGPAVSDGIVTEADKLLLKMKDSDEVKPLSVYLDELINPLQAELDDAHARIHELEAEVQELKEKLGALEIKQGEGPEDEPKLESVEQELKDAIAERVVDLRVALGKVSESDREQAVATYRKKSLEYLTDALADLTRELATSPVYRTVVHRPMVSSPGLAINTEKNVYTVDSDKSEGTPKASRSKLPDKYARLYRKDREL